MATRRCERCGCLIWHDVCLCCKRVQKPPEKPEPEPLLTPQEERESEDY